MTQKAKTGAESPPAPSSSALAPEERIRAIISKKGRELGLSSIEIRHLQNGDLLAEWHIKEFIAAALDAQATDKAAAVEKVKRESSLMPFYCGDCGRWFVYPNDHKYSPDNEKHTVSKPIKFIRAENVLAILTDSQPKEEETTA